MITFKNRTTGTYYIILFCNAYVDIKWEKEEKLEDEYYCLFILFAAIIYNNQKTQIYVLFLKKKIYFRD